MKVVSHAGSLASSSAIVLLGKVFGKIANIIGLALLARGLGSSEFGGLMLAYTVSMVSGLIFSFGMPNGLASLIPKYDKTEQNRIIIAGIIISIIGGAISCLFLLASRGQIVGITGDDRLLELLVPFAAFSLLFGISKTVVGILRGFKMSLQSVLARDILAEGISILFLIFWFLGPQTPDGGYIYWLLIPTISIICGSWMIWDHSLIDRSKRPKKADFKNIIEFSWPLTIESGFVILMSNLDVILLGVLVSSVSVGIYKAAQPIALSMIIILTSFTFLYLPLSSELYSENKLDELEDIYKICTKWIITFSLPITVTIILYSDSILRLLYGDDFVSGSAALSILAIGVFSRTFFGPNGAMIKAISKTTVDMYASLISLIVNIFLNFLMIPRFGLVGAAIATSIGFTIFNIIEVSVTYKTIKMHPLSAENIYLVLAVSIAGVILRQFLTTSFLSLVTFVIAIPIVSIFFTLIITDLTVEKELSGNIADSISKRL